MKKYDLSEYSYFKDCSFLLAVKYRELGLQIKQSLGGLAVRRIQIVDQLSEAYKQIETGRFDIAIIDHDLRSQEAGPSGTSLCQIIRHHHKRKVSEMPILMLMADPSKARVFAARDAGIHEAMKIPFNTQNLFSRIHLSIKSPKPFVRCDSYIGPCRRMNKNILWDGKERRGNKAAAISVEELIRRVNAQDKYQTAA